MLSDHGSGNIIEIDSTVDAKGFIQGSNNRVEIMSTSARSALEIQIRGDNNYIFISEGSSFAGLKIRIGTRIPSFSCSVSIGKYSSCEPECQFLVYGCEDSISIGDRCMLSNSIILRTSESPHLIFDKETGDYLDRGGRIVIGRHVWIGERAYMTKRAEVADDTIVAAAAVVTKPFSESHCVIAGNPATIRKRGVQWIRNPEQLISGSIYSDSYDTYRKKFERD